MQYPHATTHSVYHDAARLDRNARVVNRRRLLVLTLNILTVLSLSLAMLHLLSFGGWSMLKAAMFVAFFVTLPWLSIGFWNAVIGITLVVSARQSEASSDADPLALPYNAAAPITTRTAIVMALRNEDPEPSLRRLRAMHDELRAAGLGAHFDFHVLSDTNQPEIALLEERLVDEWRDIAVDPRQIHYRCRLTNEGYKAGNIEEFCRRTVDTYDFFLPLDADSFMSGREVAKLVRMCQAHPHIGILQTLAVGMPATSLFTRTFQFGMRHGMRAYTMGSAWWQADCGPFWGHNALIRMRAFHDHCSLPVIDGTGPLSGYIMSHDQVEAVLMRRAGYHCRVVAQEGESWEENPPTLPDFIRRELRWCQGNMQYWSLLAMPGLKPTSRVQLALAILMYLGAPAWMAFIGLGAVFAVSGGATAETYPFNQGVILFAVIITMSLMPKVAGVLGTLLSPAASAQYGGRLRTIVSALFEIVFSALIAPVVGFAIAVFAVGLMFGQKLDWRVQPRGVRAVDWREALGTFAPQTLFGLVFFVLLLQFAPGVLPWAAPVIAGFLVAVPLAVVSAMPALGSWTMAVRLCDIPEDHNPPVSLARVMGRDPKPLLPRGLPVTREDSPSTRPGPGMAT
ncbi:MAG: glucans biosynthesis glucosyltransferase MdoH [Pseudomonadota bacterium]